MRIVVLSSDGIQNLNYYNTISGKDGAIPSRPFFSESIFFETAGNATVEERYSAGALLHIASPLDPIIRTAARLCLVCWWVDTLRDCYVFAQVDVLDGIEQFDPILHGFLESLAAGNESHAARPFVYHGGSYGLSQIVLARSAA